MTFYAVVLFLHLTSVLSLFAALCIEVLSLFRLRRASTSAEIRSWTEPIPRLPLISMASVLVVFFSGVYLAMRMSAFSSAWIRATLGAILIIAPLGAVTGRRAGAIRKACIDMKSISSEQLLRLRDPFLKVSLGIRIAVFLGIVLLMAAKPGLWPSISIIGASLILGVFLALPRGQRKSVAVRSANYGD